MTQLNVCDPESRHTEAPFEVTDRMRERFEERLEEYLIVLTQMWRDNGEDPDSAGGQAALKAVRQSALVPERPDWMHPLHAIATIVSIVGTPVCEAERLDLRDAMRTAWAFPEKEWRQMLADSMGLTYSQVQRYAPTTDVERERRTRDLWSAKTAVYRRYDASGVLLYIGITSDFKGRDAVHRALSPWWRHMARTEVEWFPDRESALESEANAIRAEDPIFNLQHGRSDAHKRQTAYFDSTRVRA